MAKSTKKPTLEIWDRRMLELMDHLIRNNKVADSYEFLGSIGFTTKSNINQIRRGLQSFRIKHFVAAAEKYKVSFDWFFGRSNTMIKPLAKKEISGIDLIKEGVRMLEAKK